MREWPLVRIWSLCGHQKTLHYNLNKKLQELKQVYSELRANKSAVGEPDNLSLLSSLKFTFVGIVCFSTITNAHE